MLKTILSWGFLGIACGLLVLASIERLAFGEIVPSGGLKTQQEAILVTAASWYSVDSLKKEGTWKTSKGVMANGKSFNDHAYTCATRLFPLGSTLRVQNSTSKASVMVRVTDRIGKRFANKRIDLSKSAFEKIADLKTGLIRVKVERI